MDSMDFNQYFTNEALEAALKGWAESYPELTSLSEIGKSFEGRPIFLMTLTNFATGGDREKPAIWLDGNIHATELAGTTTLLYFLHQTLEGYGTDERITRLLDTCTFYVVPRINPDGAAAALASSPSFVRSGVRPYPWTDVDEGIHQQDIDGDSRILQMRIQDPNGEWKPYEEDPRLMVKRGPAEFGGTYYRLLPEGLIENWDGYQIKVARPKAGLDFNRNFPFEWRTEDQQPGAGPYPSSEPEIASVVRFVSEHANINIALTFHTFSRVLLRPFSTKPDDQMETADLEVFKTLGEIGTKITGYRNVSTYHDFLYSPKEVTTGAFDDWVYDHFGMYVFTIELWDLPTEAGIKDRKFIEWFNRHPVEEDVQTLKWTDENAGPDGYVPWYEFDHPQLGRVELGGWNVLYTWRNPPHALMTKEAERHLPYILTLGELLPHITLHKLQAKRVGDNAWAIDLVVDNPGYLPSYTSQVAKKRRTARPVMAELRLPEGYRVTLGKERMEIGHLEGRSNKDDAASVFGRSPTDNRGRVQWVVEGPASGTVEVTIRGERVGEIKATILLTDGNSVAIRQ